MKNPAPLIEVVAPSCKHPDDDASSTQSESSQFSGTIGAGATMNPVPSSSSSTSSNCPNSFEGPEKNLHIVFRPDVGPAGGFRNVSRTKLDAMLTAGQCYVLTHTSTPTLDMYVLSESSLFVYSHTLVIKTCGTTTLLLMLPLILDYAADLGMEIATVSYARKNYNFPEEQKYPHTSFQTEVAFLSGYFPDGTAQILGPLNHDHWYMYVWDADEHVVELSTMLGSSSLFVEPSRRQSIHTLHVLMQDMDSSIAKHFFKSEEDMQKPKGVVSQRMTQASGIAGLAPGLVIDAYAFDPCGYSMNGIVDDTYYYTIHITPESHCSYVSFETNALVDDYERLIHKVLDCFRPAKYAVSVCAPSDHIEKANFKIFSSAITKIDNTLVYKRKGGHTQASFEGDYTCVNANWRQVNAATIASGFH